MLIMDVFRDKFRLLFPLLLGSMVNVLLNHSEQTYQHNTSGPQLKKPDLDFLISIQTYQLLAIRLCKHEVPFALLSFCHRR